MPIFDWVRNAFDAFTSWSGWDAAGQWGWVQFLRDSVVGDVFGFVFGMIGAFFGLIGSLLGTANHFGFDILTSWTKLPVVVLEAVALALTIFSLYCVTVWVRCVFIKYDPAKTVTDPRTGENWHTPIDLEKGRKRAVTWPLLVVPHLAFALFMLHWLYVDYSYNTYQKIGLLTVLTGPISTLLYVLALRTSYNRSHPERPIVSGYWEMVRGFYRSGRNERQRQSNSEANANPVAKEHHIVPVFRGPLGLLSLLVNGLAWIWMHIRGVIMFWKWPWLDLFDILSYWRLAGVVVIALFAPIVLLLRPYLYMIAAESFRGDVAPWWVQAIADDNHRGVIRPWWTDKYGHEPVMAPESVSDNPESATSAVHGA